MKVTFPKDYKKILTIAEYENAKRIISDMKDDESTAAEYAEYAVNAIGSAYGIGRCEKVLSCSAEIAGNYRANNNYNPDSGTIDIWISGIAKTWDGFCEFGAYLTDIWSLSSDNRESIARYNMFKVIYKKKEY